MLDIAAKNVFRHKVRSVLTILGIALGIGLILALGSIGAGLSTQIEQQFASRAAYITVTASDMSQGISPETIDSLQTLPGVEYAVPISTYQISRTVRGGFGGGFGPGGMQIPGFQSGGRGGGGSVSITFTGINPDDLDDLISEDVLVTEGRKLDSSDDGKEVVLLGYTAASNQNLNVGDEIEYQHRDRDTSTTTSYFFEVVGILEETSDSSIDSSFYVPLSTCRK